MGQLKISDMFLSSPRTRPLSQPSTTPHRPQPAAPLSAGALCAQPNTLIEHRLHSRSADSTPLNRQKNRMEVHIPARSPLSQTFTKPPPPLPSIPSTPISEAASSQAGRKPAALVTNDRIPETPQQAQEQPPTTTASQITPGRAALPLQGTSPYSPIGISSSSESSDASDCEILKVLPSPLGKRKVAAAQRPQRSKKAKVERASQPSTKAARMKSTRAKPNPVLEAKHLARKGDDSDCIIEKVRPSPKKRLRNQQQANVKRRRVNETNGASGLAGTQNALESDNDSDCELVRSAPSPGRQAAISVDSDADDEATDGTNPKAQRKIAKPRKRQASFHSAVANSRAMTAVPTMNSSPVIEIPSDSSSDSSDLSDNEMASNNAQAIPPLPTENEEAGTGNLSSHNDNRESAQPMPEETESQEPPAHSDDVTGRLWEFLDREVGIAKKEPSPTPSEEDIFFTAPEYRRDDDLKKIKLEAQEDMLPIKQERDSDASDYLGVSFLDLEESAHVVPDLSDDGDEDFGDAALHGTGARAPLIKTEPGSSSPLSFEASSDGSEEFQSSPPVSYQLPLPEDVSPKPIKAEPDTVSDHESEFEGFDEDLSHSVKPHPPTPTHQTDDHRIGSSSYRLQPVYSGENLVMNIQPDTPKSFGPHHRDALVGLRSILKTPKTWPGHESADEAKYSPRPNISPLAGAEHVLSSPTERVQHSKEQAKAIRPSARKISRREPATKSGPVSRSSPLQKQSPTPVAAPAGMRDKSKTLAQLRARSWLPPRPNAIKHAVTPVPRGSRSLIKQKNRLTPVVPGSDDSEDSASGRESPSKSLTKGPFPSKKQQPINFSKQATLDLSDDDIKKQLEEQQLQPVTNSNWAKTRPEIKPSVIRDGVSEHAIKPTVSRFEKNIAAGKGFNQEEPENPTRKYGWKVDWSAPAAQTERSTHAVAAELERRGIKNDRQYGNFWYNLTMKYSKLAGSPVPLFTAKKRALDDFVEEAIKNEEERKRRRVAKMEEEEKKKKKLEGVEALMLWGAGDTDESSKSDESDCSVEDLVAKMRADMEKQRKSNGAGTSCGSRKK